MIEIATEVSTTPAAQLFVVETIHTFHMRYLVESETAEGAREIVNKQPDDEEWQQKYLGDIVLTVQPMSHEKAEEIHATSDSSWLGSPWMPIDSMITRSKDGI